MNMRLKNYKADLLKRLADREYAADYLAQILVKKDSAAFLIALKDVIELIRICFLDAPRFMRRMSPFSANYQAALYTACREMAPISARTSSAMASAVAWGRLDTARSTAKRWAVMGSRVCKEWHRDRKPFNA